MTMMLYGITRGIACLIFKVFFKGKVEGRHNIPERGGFIIASNHVSFLDPVVMGVACNRRLSYMARDTLFRNPWFSLLIRLYNAFPVRRDSADIKSLREAIKRLRQGQGLLLFPEGKRTVNNFSFLPKAGVAFLAYRANVPVIPAFIYGTDKALPKNRKLIRMHPISVLFGERMYKNDKTSYEEFSQEILLRIRQLASSLEEQGVN